MSCVVSLSSVLSRLMPCMIKGLGIDSRVQGAGFNSLKNLRQAMQTAHWGRLRVHGPGSEPLTPRLCCSESAHRCHHILYDLLGLPCCKYLSVKPMKGCSSQCSA